MSHMNPQPVNTAWPVTDDAIRAVFDSMMQDGSWGRYHGPHCDQLREELGRMHGVEHVTLCSSGTSAVELALRSVPISPGDEVIMAAYDFKANFVNVLTVGATPVLIDVVPGMPLIDARLLMDAVTERTKAIIVSHLHGHLVQIDLIRELIGSRGIIVIEDACQVPGALISRQRAGSVGNIGVLSFGGSKLLTAGRGGVILTSDAALAQRIKLYTQRGNDAYPLSEMQAAVLLPQLKQLEERNQCRLAAAQRLSKLLSPLKSLTCTLPMDEIVSAVDQPAIYKLGVLLAEDFDAAARDRVSLAARDLGVPLDPALPALHLTHSARRFRAAGPLENATALHQRLMTLHHTALFPPAMGMENLADAISKAVESVR